MENLMNQVAGRVVLITGGNAGIGRAAAIEFAKQGAKVVVSGRREAEGQEVVAGIKASGGEAIFVRADVSKERDVKAMIERTLATFGRLDCAFNNAGIEQALTPLPDQTEETYDQIMDINVKGVWLSLKHEIPAMLKTGGGAIVNNASIAGLVGFPEAPIYSASKHAVVGLTKSVALEYAKHNVRVNAVAPAAIETRMFHDFATTPEMRQMLVDRPIRSAASGSRERLRAPSSGSARMVRRSSPARPSRSMGVTPRSSERGPVRGNQIDRARICARTECSSVLVAGPVALRHARLSGTLRST